MGIKRGLTHAPEEMKQLKEITLNEKFITGQGSEKQIENFCLGVLSVIRFRWFDMSLIGRLSSQTHLKWCPTNLEE